jgi:hypothetical protein
VLHVPPKGFVRIRHFAFLANRFRASRLAFGSTAASLQGHSRAGNYNQGRAARKFLSLACAEDDASADLTGFPQAALDNFLFADHPPRSPGET